MKLYKHSMLLYMIYSLEIDYLIKLRRNIFTNINLGYILSAKEFLIDFEE